MLNSACTQLNPSNGSGRTPQAIDGCHADHDLVCYAKLPKRDGGAELGKTAAVSPANFDYTKL
jgi:hypothetical protein